MSVQTTIPPDEPTIVMTRIYDAPRTMVWSAMTEPDHVRQWWGGPGVSNPVCEMDVRPGGLWKHVMRFPDGQELSFEFVFVEVDEPERLVWQHADFARAKKEMPAARMRITLDDLGDSTRWTMVAQFQSMKERSTAIGLGFCNPIAASSERLIEHLQMMAAGRSVRC